MSAPRIFIAPLSSHTLPLGFRYNPYVLFWTGLGIDVYYGLAPVALFFLTLERCFALIWTYKYHAAAKKIMLVVELMVIAACLAICVGICVVELPIDEEKGSRCRSKKCVIQSSN